MKVLILGGTRFLGKRVVEHFVSNNAEVTVLSRRTARELNNVDVICADKTVGLKKLSDRRFDLVLDFICYNENDVYDVATNVIFDFYIVVSSAWLPRLWSGNCATELPSKDRIKSRGVSELTFKYLSGKFEAEIALKKLRKLGRKAISIRLPIVLGRGDHTGRLEFYLQRVRDGGPIIVIEGGSNIVQIASVENLAKTLVLWCCNVDLSLHPIWEALPGPGISVQEFLKCISHTRQGKFFVPVSIEKLSHYLPSYLEVEPLWREKSLPISRANIFHHTQTEPVWAEDTANWHLSNSESIGLRSEELKFIDEHVND